MRSLPRRARTVVATLASVGAVTLATGCTTSPGAAAVVGGDRISTESLQREVDLGLKDPAAQQQVGGDRAAFVRNELGRLINNMLIARAAADEHVSASNTDVDNELSALAQQAGGQQQLVQAASASGVPQQELRTFVRYYVLQQKIAEKLTADIAVPQAQLQAAYDKQRDQFDQVHSAHILVKTKKLADQILAQVRKNPSSFASLASRFSIDTGSKDNGGDLGFQGHSGLVKPFADAIFAAKPGTFLEVHSQFGWHVVHVLAHRTTTLEQATPQLKASLLQTQQQSLLQKELIAVGKRLGVHVSPRYGVWNAAKGSVDPLPASSDLSSPAATPSTS